MSAALRSCSPPKLPPLLLPLVLLLVGAAGVGPPSLVIHLLCAGEGGEMIRWMESDGIDG